MLGIDLQSWIYFFAGHPVAFLLLTLNMQLTAGSVFTVDYEQVFALKLIINI